MGFLLNTEFIPDTFVSVSPENLRLSSDGFGLFCAVGYIWPPLPEGTVTVWVGKMDFDGTMLWETTLPVMSDETYQHPILTALHDGGCAVTWAKFNMPFGTVPPIVRTITGIDAGGDHLWETSFADSTLPYIMNLRTAANGDILGVGYISHPWQGIDNNGVWLFRLSATGEKLWQTSYLDAERPWSEVPAADLIELPDGRLACTGYVRDQTPQGPINVNPFLLVVDSMGCLVPGCAQGIQVITPTREAVGPPTAPLRIFPSPAHDNTLIEAGLPGPARLIICNARGRIVFSAETAEVAQQINTGGWPAGMYHAVWFAADRRLVKSGWFSVAH